MVKLLSLFIQKLADGFDLLGGAMPKTPVVAGQVLVTGDERVPLDANGTTKYHSGTALCMYLIQWSRPDIFQCDPWICTSNGSTKIAS